MADQDIIHTAEIIKAAIPYVDTSVKGMAELFAKILDLIGSLKTVNHSENVAAYGFQSAKIDIEGLLKGIRPICSIREREIVDRILNFFNMKRMFEMYNNMMEAMKTMQEFGDFNFSDAAAGADDVTGNFTGSNFESIFRNSGFGFEQDGNNSASGNSDDSAGKKQEKDSSSNEDKNDASSSASSGNGMNTKMFEMLKAMVPPEQMSTFENLSMLLNTMSYDSSKPEDSKEQDNG